jgi:glycosyltransferase involved in cell wall biosynthesis
MGERMRAANARVDEVDFLRGPPLVAGALGLTRLARRSNPDLVQGWLYHGNLGASLARAMLPRRVPLLWGIRQSLASVDGENLFARAGIALNRMASARPDRLLFNSRTSLAEHRQFGFSMGRAEYLPNGFETGHFAPNVQSRANWRAAWGVDEATVVFGMFARYHPAKDHASFIAAAKRVRDARGSTRFVLGGTDVHTGNSALMQALQDAGIADHVHLLGERRDMAALLPALDVYVSSSASIEAFSNSVGEAMCCAVPCVVTDVGDSPAVVADTGRVVPPRDPAALAAAMIALVDAGPGARAALGELARQRIQSEFDIESVAARYAALYETLAGNGRAAR